MLTSYKYTLGLHHLLTSLIYIQYRWLVTFSKEQSLFKVVCMTEKSNAAQSSYRLDSELSLQSHVTA